MQLNEQYATVQDLHRAVDEKRHADAALAEARLDLRIAVTKEEAAVAVLNDYYRERIAAEKAARFERYNPDPDPDWEEAESRLLSQVAWLLDERDRGDVRYHHAICVVWRAEERSKGARQRARQAGRNLYQLLQAWRAGLLVDEDTLCQIYDDDTDYGAPYFDCDCWMCRPYLHDYDDAPADDEEEERLLLEAGAKRLNTRKKKHYKRVRKFGQRA